MASSPTPPESSPESPTSNAPAPERPYDLGVQLAAAGVGRAVLMGTAVVAAAVLTVSLLRVRYGSQRPTGIDTDSLPFYVLTLGTMAGMVVAAAAAWVALRPLRSTYRRGGLAAVSGFATAVVMLLCVPVHALLGLPGLIGLIVLCVFAAWRLTGRLGRLAALG